MAAIELALTLLVTPRALDANKAVDLELSFELRNSSKQDVIVYPKVARLAATSGWGGPAWDLEVHADGGPSIPMQHLRTYYGPPGMPPAGAFFNGQKTILKPDQHHKQRLSACFIPAAQVDRADVTKEALDPEGEDDIKLEGVVGHSVLALDTTCDKVRGKTPGDRGFRPGIVLFLPAAAKQLSITGRYRQSSWGSFSPPVLSVASAPVVIPVAGR